jgi:putative ABC transport system permease protein
VQQAQAFLSGDFPASVATSLSAIPSQGDAWVDVSLLNTLGLQVGDVLLLGQRSFVVRHILIQEPDRGAGFMNFAPRVLINGADLDATGLVQPASRISWRFALVGEAKAVAHYQQWMTQLLADQPMRGVQLESMQLGRPEMRQTLDRAANFLNLVALLAALLSAVAVALAARDFAARHLDDCAVLRVLGQSQRQIAWSYASEFVSAGLIASLLGVVLGYSTHHLFVYLLAGLLETALPAPSAWPLAYGLGVGLTLLLAFGLPPILQLASVPALRVIRRELGEIKSTTWGMWLTGILGFALLLLAASRDIKLGLMVVGGFALALIVFALGAWGALRLLRRTVNPNHAPTWLVLATRQLSARSIFVVVQVSALATGLLALFLLIMLRTDLLDSWRAATPAQAPNRFVINIQPDQAQSFQQQLRAAGVTHYDWYPMMRGRLVAINQNQVSAADYSSDKAKRLIDREFNLSYAATMPSHNRVVGGEWLSEEDDGLSIEEGIANTLGIQLGDVLQFDMAGVTHQARVTSVRKVDWTSMRVNFFVMYPKSHFLNVPTTYIVAFRSPGAWLDNALSHQFPNVTNVDMGATLLQIQQVLTQVSRAVEGLFVFTLLAGLLVLFAAVSVTREERARDFAIMRALGATQHLLSRIQRAELLGVGALAGFLASSVAVLLGWALARYVFDFDWHASVWVPFLGMGLGALLAWLAGWWGLREVLRRPVIQTLRAVQS